MLSTPILHPRHRNHHFAYTCCKCVYYRKLLADYNTLSQHFSSFRSYIVNCLCHYRTALHYNVQVTQMLCITRTIHQTQKLIKIHPAAHTYMRISIKFPHYRQSVYILLFANYLIKICRCHIIQSRHYVIIEVYRNAWSMSSRSVHVVKGFYYTLLFMFCLNSKSLFA